jgi:hypothetical protein
LVLTWDSLQASEMLFPFAIFASISLSKSIGEQKLVGGGYEIRTPSPLLQQQGVRWKNSEAILLK